VLSDEFFGQIKVEVGDAHGSSVYSLFVCRMGNRRETRAWSGWGECGGR
jgi:hypothetical protein